MKLLIVGDERKSRRLFTWSAASQPWTVRTAETRTALANQLDTDNFQAACVDIQALGKSSLPLLDYLHQRAPQLPVVAIVAEEKEKEMAELRARGVCACLTTPFTMESWQAVFSNHALPTPPEMPPAKAGARSESVVPQINSKDETMKRTLEMAHRAATSNAAILILGETGTGKTLLAQSIHQHSQVKDMPFVTVNCPCLNRELLESDLFGHVKGSFTGAAQDTWGKVAAAEGGTLFLDEIGDLPPSLQPKLLRLLQEKLYERIGETTPRRANIRVIAATNRDLKSEVAAGRFREDLYYRLNVISIEMPALRQRPFDIMPTAQHFLETICAELGKSAPSFTFEVRELLERHSWPGNLRELRNVIERAAILSNGGTLDVRDFPSVVPMAQSTTCQVGGPFSLQMLEETHIQMVVASSSTLEEAARILQIDKSTLYRKRKQMESRVAKFSTAPEPAAAVETASVG